MNDNLSACPWMKKVLLAAGICNLVYGLIVLLAPGQMPGWSEIAALVRYPQIWRSAGSIVSVYGIAYLIAARDPFRFWPVVFLGLLAKVAGIIGFATALILGTLPASVGWTFLASDLIWLLPFAAILWGAIRFHQSVGSAYHMDEADDPLRELKTNTGELLDDLANERPQLVVFLRHTGCTFCRESLADLEAQRPSIEASGCGIVLVHLGESLRDDAIFERYSVADLPRIADPACRLYRLFGLSLGRLSELLGPTVWIRGFIAAIVRGHGFGGLRGNALQMPGVFLYSSGQILAGFQHEHSSDRPDYRELACRIRRQSPLAADLDAVTHTGQAAAH